MNECTNIHQKEDQIIINRFFGQCTTPSAAILRAAVEYNDADVSQH